MKTPDLILEQIALGERERGANDGISDELARLAESNAKLLETFPLESMKAAVREKLNANAHTAKKPKTLSFPTVNPFRVATAACLLMVVGFAAMNVIKLQNSGADSDTIQTERIKGSGAKLFVYIKSGTKAVKLDNNAMVKEGDVLQISYLSGTDTWGAIFSVDGAGLITQHFPSAGDRSAPLARGGETSLAWAYKLDDAPSYERFFFVTSKSQFSIADMKKRIARSAAIDSGGTFDISAYLPPQTTAEEILLLK